MNHKKVYRIYCQEGLQVRKRRKKRVREYRGKPFVLPEGPNQRWSMDFTSDTFADGRKFRTLNVIDDFSRESLAIEVSTSLPGPRVASVLDRLIAFRGRPNSIVCDNGQEFTCGAMQEWCKVRDVPSQFIEPVKPMQNALVESFNGRFRDECLNENLFFDVPQARILIEAWRYDYNNIRPHSSLEGKSPKEFSEMHSSFSLAV